MLVYFNNQMAQKLLLVVFQPNDTQKFANSSNTQIVVEGIVQMGISILKSL